MRDNYPQVEQSLGLSKSPMQESQRERLERQKKFLQIQISEIDRVLELFTKYPEMEEMQDLLRRV